MTTAQLSINYFSIENIINSSILWFFNNFQKKSSKLRIKKSSGFSKKYQIQSFSNLLLPKNFKSITFQIPD